MDVNFKEMKFWLCLINTTLIIKDRGAIMIWAKHLSKLPEKLMFDLNL